MRIVVESCFWMSITIWVKSSPSDSQELYIDHGEPPGLISGPTCWNNNGWGWWKLSFYVVSGCPRSYGRGPAPRTPRIRHVLAHLKSLDENVHKTPTVLFCNLFAILILPLEWCDHFCFNKLVLKSIPGASHGPTPGSPRCWTSPRSDGHGHPEAT